MQSEDQGTLQTVSLGDPVQEEVPEGPDTTPEPTVSSTPTIQNTEKPVQKAPKKSEGVTKKRSSDSSDEILLTTGQLFSILLLIASVLQAVIGITHLAYYFIQLLRIDNNFGAGVRDFYVRHYVGQLFSGFGYLVVSLVGIVSSLSCIFIKFPIVSMALGGLYVGVISIQMLYDVILLAIVNEAFVFQFNAHYQLLFFVGMITLGVYQFWGAYEKYKKVEQGIPNQLHNPVLSAILGFIMVIFGLAIIVAGIVNVIRIQPVRGIAVTHAILGLIYMTVGCSAFGPLMMNFIAGRMAEVTQKKLVFGSGVGFLLCLLFAMTYELFSLNIVYADTVVRYVRHEAFYDVMLFYSIFLTFAAYQLQVMRKG